MRGGEHPSRRFPYRTLLGSAAELGKLCGHILLRHLPHDHPEHVVLGVQQEQGRQPDEVVLADVRDPRLAILRLTPPFLINLICSGNRSFLTYSVRH